MWIPRTRDHSASRNIGVLQAKKLSPLVDIKIIYTTGGGKKTHLSKAAENFTLLAHPNVGRQEPVKANIYKAIY